MNIKLHTIIRDITGKTGTAIVETIIQGERDLEKFLVHVDRNIRADKETIVKSLQGTGERSNSICWRIVIVITGTTRSELEPVM